MNFWDFYILFWINYSSRSSGMRYERLLETCQKGRIENENELNTILSKLLNSHLIYNISDDLPDGLFFITPEGKKEYERLTPIHWQQLEELTQS